MLLCIDASKLAPYLPDPLINVARPDTVVAGVRMSDVNVTQPHTLK